MVDNFAGAPYSVSHCSCWWLKLKWKAVVIKNNQTKITEKEKQNQISFQTVRGKKKEWLKNEATYKNDDENKCVFTVCIVNRGSHCD